MNIFFGAGKFGKKYYTCWKEYGIDVDCFADNDPALWNRQVEGVNVIPPEALKELPDDTNIFITCKNWEPVWLQLRDMGVPEHQIKRCNSGIAMLNTLMELQPLHLPFRIPEDTKPRPRSVLFGLDAGLTIRGIEFWTLNTGKEMRNLGWNICFLLNQKTHTVMSGYEDEHMVKAFYTSDSTEWTKLSHLMISMLQYKNIICNYAGYNLMAACLLKKLFPGRCCVIAIIHNDMEDYYQDYMDAEPYIDKCLFISSKMGAEMRKRGFPEEKLIYLPWKIPCSEMFSHHYSQRDEPLRIGYAGRIVVEQKRVDLLLTVAAQLAEQGLAFRMEIAGTGGYEKELRRRIQAEGLEDKVCCLGMQEDMSAFWYRQDIMVTCSEYEGHSISQCEGMAAGAVPVITDTSGARDDVEDGVNGFVVDIGNTGQMVEKIRYLYSRREQLPILGERAHKTIVERNRRFQLEKLWESILLP